MSLTNSQYDEIMRGYEARQLVNKHKQSERLEKLYALEPRIKEIDDSISTYSVACAKKLIDGDNTALAKLRQDIASFKKEKEQLLLSQGYPADYLSPIYTCPDCKDTGDMDGEKCHG